MTIKKRVHKEDNYKAVWVNGKTIRLAIDPKKPIKELKYPEFYDVKITSKCNGECSYCYQDSKIDCNNFNNLIENFKDYFSGMDSNQRPFQIACLHENTLVYGKNGAIEIKNLKIGDYVYNENGKLSKIINKIENEKETIQLIGNKGFNVICTPDHLFMNDNKQLIRADKCINKKLYISKHDDIDNNKIIDLAKYINESSRLPNKRGGSSGGIVENDKVAFMHTLTKIPRYLKLNEDIMWLYGISVAEGSKKGLTLHINEIEYRDRAINIYKNITGLNSNIYEYRDKNVCNLEFCESKSYNTIFFEVMKIGYGARNKSIKYLFNLPNELIRSALEGMFDGDGCLRERQDKRSSQKNYTLSYKTVSKKLANELVYILQTRFGIQSSIYKGMNKERKIDNRILKESEYYMVEIYGIHRILKLFPNLNLEKSNSKFSHFNTTDYIEISNIINTGIHKVYDITLEDDSSHLFTISHGVVTHNCGGGEPTLHPDFCELLEVSHDMGIVPNYTTNGINLTDEIINYTKKYSGGVAVSCHSHLNWHEGVNRLIDAGIKTNLHVIISDKKSIDNFIKIYNEYSGKVDYFVLLPMTESGRAKKVDIEWEYLKENISDDIEDIAFGANFYPYLLQGSNFDVSLYEPEIMSGYLDMSNMKLYKSSFHLEEKNI